MRAVLCGYYGKGNAGDEALLATLLQMLPTSVTPLVLSGDPAATEQQYGVESIDRQAPHQLWRAIAGADALIWGGGSLIQDITSIQSPFYYGSLMTLAQTLGKITIAWGQGIGPLQWGITRRWARSLFRGCTGVSVRDRASAHLLTDWAIPHTLAPDPVWALEAAPLTRPISLPHPRIAVVLRPHAQLTATRLRVITEALRQFQAITQCSLLLLPFQPSTDLAIAQNIHQHLPQQSEIAVCTRPQEYKTLFQQVQGAIAMRLHGLILATAAGCPCFALSYDPKVSQLMAALNLPGWELHQLPENPAQITQTWVNFYHHSQPLNQAEIETTIAQSLQHQHLLQRLL